jgi:chaperonin cofactor prefoldin
MDQNKKEVLTHLKNNHGRLANRINSLEKKTKDQISYLSNSMKETIAQVQKNVQQTYL